ncbi:glutathione S-transferase family protein [Sphingomonas sp.]|uniref:glutathione S-transferase family protein n=1 Tax=Sphingomonas sp. TaxID=28214 RepID=UPI001EBB226E|nr:glutathione S-transferase family protein [Sphingomonas sp.]MBX3594197.1 glutathione S-transferase family protein [Sphingomonas sp.]
MIFYDSEKAAPNPRRVRIFAAEKGMELPRQEVALFRGEHRGDAYRAVNPLGQTPALKLDDGTVITESVAICRYLEALHPDPPLFGEGAAGTALVEMWTRRVELLLGWPARMVWVHTHPLTAPLVPHQYTEFGESNRPLYAQGLALCDAALAETPFIAGERFGMADIVLLTTIDFGVFIGLSLPEEMAYLNDWHRRVSARSSASA